MRHIIIFLTCLIAGCHNLFSQDINYSVEKIWDNGKHLCRADSAIQGYLRQRPRQRISLPADRVHMPRVPRRHTNDAA